MIRRRRLAALLTCVGICLVGGGCGSTSSPEATATKGVTVLDCGARVRVDRPPTRAISLNQGATELMLTLGLQRSMIGTAYLDDAVMPSLRSAYESVPVVSTEYPSAESFLAKEPDFAIASYASAFSRKEGVGTRDSLGRLGIPTYVMPDGCPDADADAPWTFARDFAEIRQVGDLFGVPGKARAVIARQKAKLARALGPAPCPWRRPSATS